MIGVVPHPSAQRSRCQCFDSTEAAQGDEWARDRLHLASVHEPKMDTRAHDHALHAGGARWPLGEHAEELARADAHRKRAGDTDFSIVLEREAGYVCAAEG